MFNLKALKEKVSKNNNGIVPFMKKVKIEFYNFNNGYIHFHVQTKYHFTSFTLQMDNFLQMKKSSFFYGALEMFYKYPQERKDLK